MVGLRHGFDYSEHVSCFTCLHYIEWGTSFSTTPPFDCEAREVGKDPCVLRMGILPHMTARPTMLFCTGGSSSVYTAVYTVGARSVGVV